jgi:hypothetical protein
LSHDRRVTEFLSEISSRGFENLMNNPAIIRGALDSAQAVGLPVTPLTDGPGGYRTAGRQGSGLWLYYSCKVCFDQVWPEGQPLNALRCTSALKKTSKAVAADHLPLRQMIAQIYPLAAAIKPSCPERDIVPLKCRGCARLGRKQLAGRWSPEWGRTAR